MSDYEEAVSVDAYQESSHYGFQSEASATGDIAYSLRLSYVGRSGKRYRCANELAGGVADIASRHISP